MRALRSGRMFRAGRRSRPFAAGGPRGDGVGKPAAAFGRWRWPGRRPRRWRPPCSSCAMRALRSGRMFRAGRRSRRFAADGPRGDGMEKPAAAFVRLRLPGRRPRRWRPPCSSCAMRALRPGWAFRAGRRSRRLAAGGPRGDGMENRRGCSCAGGDPAGGRDGGGGRRRAAQCVHCALAGHSARGVGRDGSRATSRAATAWKNRRRPSCAGGDLVGGRDGGGRRARAAQCAHCALAGCSARGGGRDGSRATARAATAWENRRRCSGADGDPVGGRDGGGRRARAAQCAHCALAGRSARGGGRGSSRAAARAARARENRWRPSGAGDSDGPCGDGGARPAVETVASAPPESCLTLRRRIPLHCAARGRGKME